MNFGHSLAAEPVFEVRHNDAFAGELVPRILAFYKRHPRVDMPDESPLWNTITETHQVRLKAALEKGDGQAAAALLAALYDGTALDGFDEPNFKPGFEKLWKDAFWSAATALGVVPLFNPEQPNAKVCLLEDVFAQMEAVVGFKITSKGASNMKGAVVEDRFVPLRFLRAITILAALMRLPGWPPRSVLEIGAGTGMLAVALPFSGLYHIVDLPVVAAIQAYIVGHQVGPENIHLAGEPADTRHVCIHGMALLAALETSRFDLAINQDSLPEMTVQAAARYYSLIKRGLRPGGFFYSVNQEADARKQRHVFQAMLTHASMKLRARCPFWGRDGYLEEVWEKKE